MEHYSPHQIGGAVLSIHIDYLQIVEQKDAGAYHFLSPEKWICI